MSKKVNLLTEHGLTLRVHDEKQRMKSSYPLLLVLCLLCLIPGRLRAQGRTATLSGTVIDGQTNDPMVGAVVLIDSTRHAITDLKGGFAVTGVPVKADSARMEISFLGYKTITRKIKVTAPRTQAGTIAMQVDGKEIETVVVHQQSVMAVQKGDTVQYNAAAFKTNPDANASDLVSKMPGMRVTESGVESQGEAITRAYVDGKLLFGDDAMTALTNLPADAIESIQVFDEKSDEAKFTGYDDGSRNRALNVVTKHKVNRSTVANVNGDYGRLLEKNLLSDGRDGLFNFRGNFNTFTENNRISLFANSSNVNTGRWSSGDIATTRSAGIGAFQKWDDKLEITANYRYNDRQSVRSSYRVQEYFPTDQFETRVVQDSSYNKNNTDTHNADLRIEWKPNKTNRIFFAPRLSFTTPDSYSRQYGINTVDGETLSITNPVNTSAGRTLSTSGMLTYSHVFAKAGRYLSGSVNYSYSDSDSDGWQKDLSPESTNPRNQNNRSNAANKSATLRVMYGEPLSKSSRLSFYYLFEYQNNTSEKLAYNFLESDFDNMDPTLSNSYTRKYHAHGTGLGYNFIKEKSRLSAGIDYRNTSLLKEQLFPTEDHQDRSLNAVLPRLEFRYNFTKNKYLRINYRTSSPVPSVEQFQNVINTTDLLRLSAGNPNLKPSYNHTIAVNYNSSNIEKSHTYFLRFSAGTTRNRISNQTILFMEETVLPEYNDFVAQKGSQLTRPVNLNGYYTTQAATGFSFPFNAIRTNINLEGGYTFSHIPSYTGTQLNHSNQHAASFRLGLVSNVSENLDFNITSDTRYTFASNSAKTNTRYWSETVEAQVNWIFLGGFVLNNTLSFNYNRSAAMTGYTQNFTLWNVGVGRKFLKRRNAEVRVTVYDLLKQRKSLTHTIGDTYIQDQWSYIRGRYVMATFSYRFNSMNRLSNPSANRQQRQEPPEGGEFRRGEGGPPPGGFRQGGGPPPGGGRPF